MTEIQLDIGVENEVQLSQDEVNGIELVENEVLLPEAALGDSLIQYLVIQPLRWKS